MHFASGSKTAAFQAGNFVDSSEIDFTVTAGTSVTAALINGSIANARLTNSSIYVTAGGGLTGDGSVALGASASLAVGAGTGITVNANDVALKNAGSLTGNVLTKWDSGNGQLINSGLTDDGTSLNIARNTGVTGWLNVTGAITGSAISSSGTLSGLTISSGNTITAGTNVLVPNGYITAGSPGGAPNTAGAVQGVIGFFSTLSTTGNLTVTGDTTLTGDLTVAGTASFQNTTSLLVADKFVLLASGSTSLTDGGLIVAYNAAGSGSAIFLEAGTAGSTGTYGRFAVAYDVAAGVSSVAANEYVVTATTAAGAPSASPTWGGSTTGYGNIYVNSSTQDIFIYS